MVQNGTPPIRLRTRDDAREFNASLPCGARLVSADLAEAVWRRLADPVPVTGPVV